MDTVMQQTRADMSDAEWQALKSICAKGSKV